MKIKNMATALVILSFVLIGFSASAASNPNYGQAATPTTQIDAPKADDIRPLLTPTPPHIDAGAYVLLDVNSGAVLTEKDADKRRAPASLTKMMTLYIASDSLKKGRLHLSDKVRISNNAWKAEGSRMFVQAGEFVSVEDLIKGIIVDSGNDACVALAEHIAGSETSFADLMNQYAQGLGMNQSHFVDSTGMPNPNHYTTARDLSILGRALVLNFPEEYRWYKQKWFKYNNIKQPNRNRLLWHDETVDGIKTGHTDEAGFCLVASAKRNNMRLLAVVMGSPSDSDRAEDSQHLLDYGFRFFETHALYQAGQNLSEPAVWQGVSNTVATGIKDNLLVTIPTGSYKQIKAEMLLPKDITAPITKGQKLGEVKIYLNDKVLTSRPLIALDSNDKAGIWKRSCDRLKMLIHRWFSKDVA